MNLDIIGQRAGKIALHPNPNCSTEKTVARVIQALFFLQQA